MYCLGHIKIPPARLHYWNQPVRQGKDKKKVDCQRTDGTGPATPPPLTALPPFHHRRQAMPIDTAATQKVCRCIWFLQFVTLLDVSIIVTG